MACKNEKTQEAALKKLSFALEMGITEAKPFIEITEKNLHLKSTKTELKKLSLASDMGITEVNPFIERTEKNLHLKYTKDFKQELILANHYEISRDGEYHRSLVRLNNIYIDVWSEKIGEVDSDLSWQLLDLPLEWVIYGDFHTS